MKTLCASVLAFESIVVLLAIPVGIVVGGIPAAIGVTVGCALVVACIVIAAMQRRSWGVAAGWVLQILIILTGFFVPWMFFLGAVFTALWFAAIRYGRRGDSIKAAHQAQQPAA